jgi:ribonuclease HI
VLGLRCAPSGLHVWFDGSTRARHSRGGAALASPQAGAAAVLEGSDGLPLGRVLVALPGETSALQAEAQACLAACAALAEVPPGAWGGQATLYGDNRLVLRHADGIGRLRDPVLASALDAAVSRLFACGWTVQWVLVGRAFNDMADSASREARLLPLGSHRFHPSDRDGTSRGALSCRAG